MIRRPLVGRAANTELRVAKPAGLLIVAYGFVFDKSGCWNAAQAAGFRPCKGRGM